MSKKRVTDLLKQIKKDYGDSVASKASQLEAIVKVIPTASFRLNLITGIGGIPRGYMTEVYGLEHSGKTTMILESIAAAQKDGLTVLYLDIEHRFYKPYAKGLGVDLENLVIIHPETAEEGLDLASKVIELGSVEYVIIDSVAALLPAVENENDVGAANMGSRAKLISQFLRKTTHNLYKYKIALVLVNRPTAVIGQYYGPSTTTTGGQNIKNQASLRIEVKKGKVLSHTGTGDNKKARSQEMIFRITKNTFSIPYRKVTAELILSVGINQPSEIIDAAVYYEFIEKKSSMYYFNDETFRGKEALSEYLIEHTDKTDKLKKEILKIIRGETP